MWVPLFEVKAGEYELIELNAKSKHVYTHLDNDRLSEGLHEALGRYHASGSVCEEDRRFGRRGTAGICLFACGDRRDALQAVRVAPPDL